MSVMEKVRCAPVSFQCYPTVHFVMLSCSCPPARCVRSGWHEMFGERT